MYEVEVVPKCPRHFGMVPKCLGFLRWTLRHQCRNVLGPKCLRSKVSIHPVNLLLLIISDTFLWRWFFSLVTCTLQECRDCFAHWKLNVSEVANWIYWYVFAAVEVKKEDNAVAENELGWLQNDSFAVKADDANSRWHLLVVYCSLLYLYCFFAFVVFG